MKWRPISFTSYRKRHLCNKLKENAFTARKSCNNCKLSAHVYYLMDLKKKYAKKVRIPGVPLMEVGP